MRAYKFELPWSEQKKPCLHLGQDSLEDKLVAVAAAGVEIGFFWLGATFANTGFSVVCLPVLHLHHRRHIEELITIYDQFRILFMMNMVRSEKTKVARLSKEFSFIN